ncbi:MAG: hypothetical protein WC326_08925 [Candidatus Delongbacteria bacterium]
MRVRALLVGLLLWAGATDAILQLDLPAATLDEACLGELQARLFCVGSARPWPASAILTPSGHPAHWHLIFQYDDELRGKQMDKVELQVGKEHRQWKPGKLEAGYPVGPAFPLTGKLRPLAPCAAGAAPALLRLVPDPKSRATTIQVYLGREGAMRLEVLDLLGNSVSTLGNGSRQRGLHNFLFTGAGLPAGLYLLKLEAEGRREIRKLLLS